MAPLPPATKSWVPGMQQGWADLIYTAHGSRQSHESGGGRPWEGCMEDGGTQKTQVLFLVLLGHSGKANQATRSIGARGLALSLHALEQQLSPSASIAFLCGKWDMY